MREPGFYWLKDKADGVFTVGHWDGTFWTFLASLMMISEDRDEDVAALAQLARYEIGARILEPAG